jgi:hypothetical protein
MFEYRERIHHVLIELYLVLLEKSVLCHLMKRKTGPQISVTGYGEVKRGASSLRAKRYSSIIQIRATKDVHTPLMMIRENTNALFQSLYDKQH